MRMHNNGKISKENCNKEKVNKAKMIKKGISHRDITKKEPRKESEHIMKYLKGSPENKRANLQMSRSWLSYSNCCSPAETHETIAQVEPW